MEWNREQVTLLIDMYREKRELWDPSYEHYKNRNRKRRLAGDSKHARHQSGG
ncbi:hypothetical protein J6590_107170, partial [Homalodisca vitripennis]